MIAIIMVLMIGQARFPESRLQSTWVSCFPKHIDLDILRVHFPTQAEAQHPEGVTTFRPREQKALRDV